MANLRLHLAKRICAIKKKVIYAFAIIAQLFILMNVVNASASELVVKKNIESSEDTQLSQEQLRTIFFSRQTRWPDGKPVRVFVLPDKHPIHIRFSKEILGVYPYQLRSAWDRMMYSGTGVPPITVKDTEEMRNKIDQIPGAIGYFEE